jgi:hypothetical protein
LFIENSVQWPQAWEAVKEFLYDTFKKEFGVVSIEFRKGQKHELHINKNVISRLSIIEILEQAPMPVEIQESSNFNDH